VIFDYFEDIGTPHVCVAPSMAVEAPASFAGGGDSGKPKGLGLGKGFLTILQADRFGIAGSRTKKMKLFFVFDVHQREAGVRVQHRHRKSSL